MEKYKKIILVAQKNPDVDDPNQTDLYSFGTVLYELITGRPPFEGDTPIATATKHITDKPERLSVFRPDIPKGIENAVLKLLHKYYQLHSQFQVYYRFLLYLLRSNFCICSFFNYKSCFAILIFSDKSSIKIVSG